MNPDYGLATISKHGLVLDTSKQSSGSNPTVLTFSLQPCRHTRWLAHLSCDANPLGTKGTRVLININLEEQFLGDETPQSW